MCKTLSLNLDLELQALMAEHVKRVRDASPIPTSVKRSTVAKHLLRKALQSARRKAKRAEQQAS